MNPFESKYLSFPPNKSEPAPLLLSLPDDPTPAPGEGPLLLLDLPPPVRDDTIIANGEEIGIRLPWIEKENTRNDFMARIKGSAIHNYPGIPARRWDPKLKRWFFPTRHATAVAEIVHTRFPDIAVKIRNHPAVAEWRSLEIRRRIISSGLNPDELHGVAKQWYEQAKKTFPGLYDHQILTLLFLEFNHGKAIITDEMGTGKSAPALCYNSSKGNRTIIVCPAAVKFNWALEWERWHSHNPFDEVSCGVIASVPKKHQSFWTAKGIQPAQQFDKWPQVLIVSYDSLAKVLPFRNYYNSVIFDECFPYETLISTTIGELPIGFIVENNLNIDVISYNLDERKCEIKPIRRLIKKNLIGNLYHIKHSNGEIICTENHKIWIEGKGYVRADKIKKGQKMLLLSQEGPTRKQSILQSNLRNEMDGKRKKRKLQMVQKRICNLSSEYPKKILQQNLFFYLENDGDRTSMVQQRKCLEEDRQETWPQSRMVQTYEREQSNVRSRNQRKSAISNGRKAISCSPWRKWKNGTHAIEISRSIGQNRYNGILSQNKTNYPSNGKITLFLQNRYSHPRKDDSNRSRWNIPHYQSGKNSRSKEKQSIITSRVESIEILEQGSRRGNRKSDNKNQFVYNLEIDDNHNYFANSILVSNCHLLKNYHTKRSQNCVTLAEGKDSIIALSGTPLKNRPRELFTVLNMIRPTEFPNWYAYAKRYCKAEEETIYLEGGVQQQILKSDGASNLDELNSRLQSFMLRRTAEEVLNLPPFTEETIEVESQLSPINFNNPPLKEVTRLRQYYGSLKGAEIPRLLNKSSAPVVFFYHWKVTAAAMKEQLKDSSFSYAQIDGTTPDYRRAQIINYFQSNSIDILLCSTLVGGVGINLTAASTAFLIDRELTLADETQAAKRLHRIGQIHPVKFIRVHIKGSIDQIIDQVNQTKGAIAAAAIDGAKWEEEKGINSVWKKLIRQN